MQVLEYDYGKCIGCLACIRNCPVKSIVFNKESKVVDFNFDRCIGCGICIKVCAVNAISPANSKKEVKNLLQNNNDVVAICGPSISGEFVDISDYRTFVQMIRKLGFTHVNEVSFGADLVSSAYNKLLGSFRGKYFITANCPSIVSIIEKYYPELIPNIAPIVSPAFATAMTVRKIYGDQVKVVYISPCLASKDEIKSEKNKGLIDAVLTFTELRELFEEDGIVESALDYSDFDEPLGYKGSLFPAPGGFIEAMECEKSLLNGKISPVEGANDAVSLLKIFKKNALNLKRHFDIYLCDGCMMGPGTSQHGDKFLRKSVVVDYAKKRLNEFDTEKWHCHMNEFSSIDLSRTFKNDSIPVNEPDENQIRQILTDLGINGNDHSSGCGACGFASCKEFAKSVFSGISTPYTCLSYSFRSQNQYINNLRAVNEKLINAESALKESERKSNREKLELKEYEDIISNLLQKVPFGIVISDNNLKAVYANKKAAIYIGDGAEEIEEIVPGLKGADLNSLLPKSITTLIKYVLQSGENTGDKDIELNGKSLLISVFSIRKHSMAGAFIRDIDSPVVQREQIINRVTEAIDENLRMVQEIGYLLGEGASKTERTLNSIINNYLKPKE